IAAVITEGESFLREAREVYPRAKTREISSVEDKLRLRLRQVRLRPEISERLAMEALEEASLRRFNAFAQKNRVKFYDLRIMVNYYIERIARQILEEWGDDPDSDLVQRAESLLGRTSNWRGELLTDEVSRLRSRIRTRISELNPPSGPRSSFPAIVAGFAPMPLYIKLILSFLILYGYAYTRRELFTDWLHTKGYLRIEKIARSLLFTLTEYSIPRYVAQSFSYAPGLTIREIEPDIRARVIGFFESLRLDLAVCIAAYGLVADKERLIVIAKDLQEEGELFAPNYKIVRNSQQLGEMLGQIEGFFKNLKARLTAMRKDREISQNTFDSISARIELQRQLFVKLRRDLIVLMNHPPGGSTTKPTRAEYLSDYSGIKLIFELWRAIKLKKEIKKVASGWIHGSVPLEPQEVMQKALENSFAGERFIAEAIYEAVKDSIPYKFDEWNVSAEETLSKGYGMCANKTKVMVKLLRLAGIENVKYRTLKVKFSEKLWALIESKNRILRPQIMVLRNAGPGDHVKVEVFFKDGSFKRYDPSFDKELENIFGYHGIGSLNVLSGYESDDNLYEDLDVFVKRRISRIGQGREKFLGALNDALDIIRQESRTRQKAPWWRKLLEELKRFIKEEDGGIRLPPTSSSPMDDRGRRRKRAQHREKNIRAQSVLDLDVGTWPHLREVTYGYPSAAQYKRIIGVQFSPKPLKAAQDRIYSVPNGVDMASAVESITNDVSQIKELERKRFDMVLLIEPYEIFKGYEQADGAWGEEYGGGGPVLLGPFEIANIFNGIVKKMNEQGEFELFISGAKIKSRFFPTYLPEKMREAGFKEKLKDRDTYYGRWDSEGRVFKAKKKDIEKLIEILQLSELQKDRSETDKPSTMLEPVVPEEWDDLKKVAIFKETLLSDLYIGELGSKKYIIKWAKDKRNNELYENEYKALQALNRSGGNRHFPRPYCLGKRDRRSYIIMDYIEGTTFEQLDFAELTTEE
ncbi:MAG: fructosamine kinase family protein, partial [Candidatus Omnitrophica bacterium]|nr:fructosamine kinase family protein [Candidatus Omnitrophota bacterium]